MLKAAPIAHRLFFAVYPDPEMASEIAKNFLDLRETLQLTGKPQATQRLHVTLAFLNDYGALPASEVTRAKRAGEQVSMRPFEAAFDQVASFSHGPLVMLPADGADGFHYLHRHLAEALAWEGLKLKDRVYSPHMTLSYKERQIRQAFIPPVKWRVEGFSLIHSLVGQSQHIPLASWPLTGEAL